MTNSYTNKRQQQYYLHSKVIESGKKKTKRTIRFFSKKAEDAIEIPQEYCVVENEKTGLPFLKKKADPTKKENDPAATKPKPENTGDGTDSN